jgi:hypothetical protein
MTNDNCKGPSVLTLGNLQGDQSKVQLKKESAIYTKPKGISDQRSSVWLCLIMTLFI